MLIVDQLLQIGYLKLIGGLLLLWIGVKLVQGEEEGEGGVKAAGSLWAAIRTIIIADAVMSLDNAIAIAAAAKGDTTLIVLGLIISIPLIIFGATLIMMLLNRFPIIVIAGGGLLGWIAGEVLATDPAYAQQLAAALPNAKTIFEIGGAVITVAIGYLLQYRAKRRHALAHADPVDLAAEKAADARGRSSRHEPDQGNPGGRRWLAELRPRGTALPRHGGGRSRHGSAFPERAAQPARRDRLLRGREQINSYHREEGNKALASAVELAGKASVPAQVHIGVGRQGEVVRDFAKKLGAGMVVMGTRGHTGLSGRVAGLRGAGRHCARRRPRNARQVSAYGRGARSWKLWALVTGSSSPSSRSC